MDIKMIEVAVGILAAEPDKTKGLRNWAVHSKDVELTDEAKNALREKPLPVCRCRVHGHWRRTDGSAN